MEKLSSMKLVPGAKKFGDPYCRLPTVSWDPIAPGRHLSKSPFFVDLTLGPGQG